MPYIKKQDAEKITNFILDIKFEITHDLIDAESMNFENNSDSMIEEIKAKISNIDYFLTQLNK